MSPAVAATAVTMAPPPREDKDGDRRRALFAGFGPIEDGIGDGGNVAQQAAVDADFSAFAASARSLEAGDVDDDLVGGDLREERVVGEGEEGTKSPVTEEESKGVDLAVYVDPRVDGASSAAGHGVEGASGAKDGDGEGQRRRKYVTPADFELLTVIGMGAFGKVLQVRNRHSKQILAMKVISKRLLRRRAKNHIRQMQLERDILTRIRHPFIVTMHCSFQTPQKLFLVMDFLAGGELFLRLGREGVFLENTAAFYLAEMVLALEHLHNHHILHRDLKPENVLLGSDGHVCLTDFGLAKDFTVDEGWSASSATATATTTEDGDGPAPSTNGNDDPSGVPPPPSSLAAAPPTSPLPGRAKTICGTTEYMAPEMIAKKGYGRAADYWSLGCIAYEMLSGTTPFHSRKGERDVLRKILQERVRMPDGATAAACKLLKGLLHRNPLERLGAARGSMFQIGGVAGLKQCQFFQHIRWDKLEAKEIDPPATFAVDGDDDLRHFHDEFKNMRLPRSVTEIVDDPDYLPRRCESENFRGFSFVQDDFVLPERGSVEYESYWNNPDAECESLSECASSVVSGDSRGGGGGGGGGESAKDGVEGSSPSAEAGATPVKKKRPPRKRKKKKNGPAAAAALNSALESTPEGGREGAENEEQQQRTPPSAVVAVASSPAEEARPKATVEAKVEGGTIRSDGEMDGTREGGKPRVDGPSSPKAAAASTLPASGAAPQSRLGGHVPSAAPWSSSPKAGLPSVSTQPGRVGAEQVAAPPPPGASASPTSREAWTVQRQRVRGSNAATTPSRPADHARTAAAGSPAPTRTYQAPPGSWAARTASPSAAGGPGPSPSRTGGGGPWKAVAGAHTGPTRGAGGVGPEVGGGRPAIATQQAFWPSLGASSSTKSNGAGGGSAAGAIGRRGRGRGGGGGGGGSKAKSAWSTAASSSGGAWRSPAR